MSVVETRPKNSRAPAPVVMWRDVFALVDQGKTEVSDYPILERMVLEQAARYSGGLGCLVIIPSTASPPSEEVRRAINETLTRLAPKLRCLSWLVEGSGFRAATVRAALSGLRMLNRPPYPTLIASDMTEAVGWILPHLSDGKSREAEVPTAVEAILRARSSARPAPVRS